MKSSKKLDLDLSFFDWQVFDVKAQVEFVKNLKDELYKNVFSVKKGEQTFKNTLQVLDEFARDFSRLASRISTVTNLHPENELRFAAQKVEVELGKISIEIDNDYKLFLQIKQYLDDERMQASENLSEVQKFIIIESKKGYKRSGMLLPAKERAILKKKKNQLQKLESDYGLEYNQTYSKGLWLSEDALAGVPLSICNSWEKREIKGKKERFVKMVDGSAILSYCSNRETRKKFYDFVQTLGSLKNLERLQKAVILRQEMAQMLGYKSYEAYALENELISTTDELSKFMENFDKSIYKSAKADYKKLREVAKEEKLEEMSAWDMGFLTRIVEEKRTSISSEILSEHLEYEHVLETLLGMLRDIFGVEVERVAEDKTFYDKQVRLYEWRDLKTRKVLGYSLLDLFPREGKYGHFCVAGCDLNKEGGNYNSRSLIANFQMMEKDGKRLLSFGDVQGLLHEMGHLLHSMVDTSPYFTTNMSSVSRDFVEIPSQFMECFWEEDFFVKKILKHYKTNNILPTNLRQKISAKNTSFLALSFSKTFDLVGVDTEMHGENWKKYTKDVESLRKLGAKKFSRASLEFGLESHEQQRFLARFGHLMGGYEGLYYSYMASYAYMREVWGFFKSAGINKKSGSKYRNEVLSVAGTKSESEILKKYLGEKPKLTTFKKFIESL